jgi:hypothetical protein
MRLHPWGGLACIPGPDLSPSLGPTSLHPWSGLVSIPGSDFSASLVRAGGQCRAVSGW